MKYIESNIPEAMLVRVTHYHHGNHTDLANGGAKYVTHAWLIDTHGQTVSEAMSVGHGKSTARSRRPIRRAIAVGRAFKRWHVRQQRAV